jgi:hypothetical protein
MKYLGVMRGSGMIAGGDERLGRADYEIEGFLVRPGEVAGSGEIRMPAEALGRAFGRRDLYLTTDDGQVFSVRFSGRRLAAGADIAHADFGGALPDASAWRR